MRALFATVISSALLAPGCAGTAADPAAPATVAAADCDRSEVIYSVTTLNVEPLRESKLEINECGNWSRMVDVGYGFTGRLSAAQVETLRENIDQTQFEVDHTGSRSACEEGAYVWVSVSDGRQAEFMVAAQCSPWRPDPSLVKLYEGVEQALEAGDPSDLAADQRARKP